ncbi:MAG: SLC13 family permease [Candidatus Bathyarchaeota archaeon]
MLLLNYKAIVGLLVLLYLIVSLIVRSRKPAIPIWSIMVFSSFVVVVTGLVNIDDIESTVNMNVIFFLIGMFSLVSIAENSGLLEAVSYWFVSMFKSRVKILYASAFLYGLLAAFAVNDTVALMGVPIAYLLARIAGIELKAMFLLLAFSLTVGSVMTPIGNPQNMLIAVCSGTPAPFINFLAKLFLPTMINLLVTAYLVKVFYRITDAPVEVGLIPHEAIRNRRDAILGAAGLTLTLVAFVANDCFELLGYPYITEKGFIPFIIVAGIYLISTNPRKVLAGVDWGTIVFFIGMFITMTGVWKSGVIEPLFRLMLPEAQKGFTGIMGITLTSILVSQLLSNVPFTNIYISYMKSSGYAGADTQAWLTLAAASTIAGNLTILGAASNIIVLETLETRFNTTITFKEFFRIGLWVTIVNMLIYIPFLMLIA